MDSNSAPAPKPERTSWRIAFRVIRWAIYVSTIVSLLLILHKTPAPHVETSPQAAARAEEKIQQAEHALASGQNSQLRLDESELNSYLASHLDLSGNSAAIPEGQPDVEAVRSSVRDVKVELLGDRVRAYVVFDMHGKDMSLQLEGKLHAAGGYMQFEPIAGQIGSFPIPQSTLESAVRRLFESAENREKLKLPPEVSDIRIENGEIVLSYK